MKHLIEVQQALENVLSQPGKFKKEMIPLSKAYGRILAEEVYADRDMPPYDRISMDGIAIAYADYKAGIREFQIEGLQETGLPAFTKSGQNTCIEVMTGAILPINTDTVIQYEHLEMQSGLAAIIHPDVRSGQNVHKKGLDQKSGTLLIPKGVRITNPMVIVMASVGKSQVEVYRRPRIHIFSSGDEVIPIRETPKKFQIRQSNGMMLLSCLRAMGIKAKYRHLPDDPEIIHKRIRQALDSSNAIILTGAVSKGKKDFIPHVLDSLGVKKLFHGVLQRPGKPFLFGRGEKAAVFAFPGNPVSAYVGFHKYFIPWIKRSYRLDSPSIEYAKLKEDFEFHPGLTYFLPVKLSQDKHAQWYATPQKGQGSGDYFNLTKSNAIMELPKEKTLFKKGETYPIIRFI